MKANQQATKIGGSWEQAPPIGENAISPLTLKAWFGLAWFSQEDK